MGNALAILKERRTRPLRAPYATVYRLPFPRHWKTGEVSFSRGHENDKGRTGNVPARPLIYPFAPLDLRGEEMLKITRLFPLLAFPQRGRIRHIVKRNRQLLAKATENSLERVALPRAVDVIDFRLEHFPVSKDCRSIVRKPAAPRCST